MRHRSLVDQQKNLTITGQALVEFAVLLPIILILILGAVDFGRLFYSKIVLTNAAREGANYLSRNLSDMSCVSGNCNYPNTWSAILNEGDSSGVRILYNEVDWASTNCCTVGSYVAISIVKEIDLIFDGFFERVGITDGPITITTSVRMVVH